MSAPQNAAWKADIDRSMDHALDELATLGFNGARYSASKALDRLTKIVAASTFNAPHRHAPVQIVTPADLGGVPFDALWFLSSGDTTWPQFAQPTPLLPRMLQRSLGVAGTDAARDQADAAALTTFIARNAQVVVFSYAIDTGDGHQGISPAVASLGLSKYEDTSEATPHQALTYIEADEDTTLSPLPDRDSHGGSDILALQAACPFRAFAEKRLHSTEPDMTEAGLDPRERGSIVHRVMEHFWTSVEDQQTLLGMSDKEVFEALSTSIDHALESTRKLQRSPWDIAYVATQSHRLQRLLMPWLRIEAKRSPFKVLSREQNVEPFALGPLRLRLRVDRTDLTSAGPLILDYKTGSAEPSEWLGERPDAPQLPLYAIIVDEPLAGVAFALLRAGDKIALKGFADDNSVLGKCAAMDAPTLEEQVAKWRTILEGLAVDYASGAAQVSPKTYPQTCKYCTQRILCRLDPATLDLCEDEDTPFAGAEASLG